MLWNLALGNVGLEALENGFLYGKITSFSAGGLNCPVKLSGREERIQSSSGVCTECSSYLKALCHVMQPHRPGDEEYHVPIGLRDCRAPTN